MTCVSMCGVCVVYDTSTENQGNTGGTMVSHLSKKFGERCIKENSTTGTIQGDFEEITEPSKCRHTQLLYMHKYSSYSLQAKKRQC